MNRWMVGVGVACLVWMQTHVASAGINDGLLLYFNCDQPFVSNVVPDASSYHNNGTAFRFQNGTDTPGGVEQVPDGLIGGACRFNGTGPAYDPTPPIVGGVVDYIKVVPTDLPNGHVLNVGNPADNPSGQFTLAAWYNVTNSPDESNNQSPLIEWNKNASGAEAVHMWAYASFGTGANLVDVDGGYHFISAPADQSRGEWHHVAVTYDHTTGAAKVYVDGQLKAESNFVVDPRTDAELFFGRRPWDYQRVNGLLDDIRIYNRALSAQEVQQLFELVPVPFITKVEFSNSPTGSGNRTSFHTGETLYIRLQNITLDTVTDNFTVTADVGGLAVPLADPEGDGSYAGSTTLPFPPGTVKVKVKASSPTRKKFLNYDSDITVTP